MIHRYSCGYYLEMQGWTWFGDTVVDIIKRNRGVHGLVIQSWILFRDTGMDRVWCFSCGYYLQIQGWITGYGLVIHRYSRGYYLEKQGWTGSGATVVCMLR